MLVARLFSYVDQTTEEKQDKPEKEAADSVGSSKSKTPHQTSGESVQSGTRDSGVDVDVRAATFLDVAVLRCLFISQWGEEGIHWALQFLYRR